MEPKNFRRGDNMSKVYEYFEERRKMGIIDNKPSQQKKMDGADYDDMKYKEDQDHRAMKKTEGKNR